MRLIYIYKRSVGAYCATSARIHASLCCYFGTLVISKTPGARHQRISCILAIVILVFTIAATLGTESALSQVRRLPKAGFPVLTTSPDSDNSATPYGMHLSPGLDRTKGEKGSRYDPGEPDLHKALVRWESRQMPLLIWISPGLMLPECPLDEIQSTRVDYVTSLLQQRDNPLSALAQAPGWTPEVNDQVASGFEQWREFENEGLFHFAFTDDPHNANILVFFCGSFKDSSQPSGISIGGITSAQVYTLEQAHSSDKKLKPVVMELSTLINSTPERMIGASAHEFGHALGIKAHSPYREDIMYVDRVVNQLSPSDKATIRWLYHQTPQYVL